MIKDHDGNIIFSVRINMLNKKELLYLAVFECLRHFFVFHLFFINNT